MISTANKEKKTFALSLKNILMLRPTIGIIPAPAFL